MGTIYRINTVEPESMRREINRVLALMSLRLDELNRRSESGWFDQEVKTVSSPEFVTALLSGLSASKLIATDASNNLVSTDADTWIDGTADQITVSDDGDGSVTLGTPTLLVDGTAGRVLRFGSIQITDGTNPATLRCQLRSIWNGDSTGYVDNIAKDNNYYGGFSLNLSGQALTLDAVAILSGYVVGALGWMAYNDTTDTGLLGGVDVVYGVGGTLSFNVNTSTGGLGYPDMTTLVDTGIFGINFFYITEA
uniref:Uncharacterized protein n=2 Tax=viral metagenome TaxID=1070528 RepID=A0A6M3IFR7_9ZZZZ